MSDTHDPSQFVHDPLNQRTRKLDPRPATPFERMVDGVLLTLGAMWSAAFAAGAALLGSFMLAATASVPARIAGGVVLVVGVVTFVSLAFLAARGAIRAARGR